jgi:thiamine pyrophosphate-dependent acetolactate synthase large subunit-like protein
VDLNNPHFEDIARSFKIPYFKIGKDHEIETTLNQIWELKGPSLLDLRPNYEKMSPLLKGIVMHRVKVTPWSEKLHVLKRYIKRTLFTE